jgi:hypothetical protein
LLGLRREERKKAVFKEFFANPKIKWIFARLTG